MIGYTVTSKIIYLDIVTTPVILPKLAMYAVVFSESSSRCDRARGVSIKQLDGDLITQPVAVFSPNFTPILLFLSHVPRNKE